MGESWIYVWMIAFVIGCTVGLRVLMELFIVGEALAQGWFTQRQEPVSVLDYRNIICVLFPFTNLMLGGMILFYSANIKKRSLSNREKIMLKDL